MREERSRISIDVSSKEHQELKAMAALNGKFINDHVLERMLVADEDGSEAVALEEPEKLLDERIRRAENGAVRRRTVRAFFQDAYREPNRK